MTTTALLAHHYSRSGNTQKAVDYLYLAGQQAVQRSANEEAINHLMTALGLLTTMTPSTVRDQQELLLRPLTWSRIDCDKGVGRTRSRTDLLPRAGAMPTGWRVFSTVLRSLGAVARPSHRSRLSRGADISRADAGCC